MIPEFNLLLKTYLDKKALSFSEFGRIVGVSHAYISQLCAGKRKPPERGLEEWAEALGIEENTGKYRTFARSWHLGRADKLIQDDYKMLLKHAKKTGFTRIS